jgi:hypothetical protein
MVAHATDLITVTRLGRRFKASRRTVAHIEKTVAEFKRVFPHASLTIIQTSYNTTVAASAGTHDFDACFDWGFTGELLPGQHAEAQWQQLQHFLRRLGWGCWWRHTGSWAAQSEWHVHGFSLPVGLASFTTKVGEFIDGGLSSLGRAVASSQLDDYLTEKDGLADHACDHTWRPQPISSSVFHYWSWVLTHGIPRSGSVK